MNALLIFLALVAAWVLGWVAGGADVLAHIRRKCPAAYLAYMLGVKRRRAERGNRKGKEEE